MSVFDAYSSYYDLLYRDKDYSAEAEYVLRQISRITGPPKTVLELGCGTGLHAICLSHAGLAVTGIDMSPSMLKRARERMAHLPMESQSRLEFSLGDIRSARTGRKYDAILSLFHVISYQTTNEDLLRAFTTARDHMDRDSIFAFDFWYGPAVLGQRPEVRTLDLEDERVRVLRVANPELKVNEDVVNVKYTVVIENKADRTVHRVAEQHAMRYLFLPELAQLLSAAGLKVIVSRAWMTDDPPNADTWGAFVVAQRAS